MAPLSFTIIYKAWRTMNPNEAPDVVGTLRITPKLGLPGDLRARALNIADTWARKNDPAYRQGTSWSLRIVD